MASIRIINQSKNLIFAAEVANQTGAEFREEGQWVIIENSPILTISRYVFNNVFEPRKESESAWRSLLLNKTGHLVKYAADEIVISDKKDMKRPSFLREKEYEFIIQK